MHLDAALDVHERPPERGQQVAFSRELSGLYWLDSIIVVLSLGSMSILSGGATVSVAAIATAFLLAPRYVGAGCLAHSETVAVRAAPEAASDALAELGAREPGAAPSPECGTAGTTGSLGATLPGAQAHWVALAVDGLPVEAVWRFVRALGTLVTRRVQHLEGVLDRYRVPHALRDGSNLVTGLAGVRPAALPAGQITHARRGAELGQWQPAALLATAQPLLQSCVEDVASLIHDLLAMGGAVPADTTVVVHAPQTAVLPVVTVQQQVLSTDALHLPRTLATVVGEETANGTVCSSPAMSGATGEIQLLRNLTGAGTGDSLGRAMGSANEANGSHAIAPSLRSLRPRNTQIVYEENRLSDESDSAYEYDSDSSNAGSASSKSNAPGTKPTSFGYAGAAAPSTGQSNVAREVDRWLDWREDGAHKLARATFRQEVPQHEWPPRPIDVREVLNFALANDAVALSDGAAQVLTSAVLDVYVGWVVEPSGRLQDLRGEHTRAELEDSKSDTYRLPLEVIVTAAWHVLTHVRELDAAASTGGGKRFYFVDPGGHAKKSALVRPSAKMLRKAKTALNIHGVSFGVPQDVVSAAEVASAYELSLRELNRVVR